MAADSAIRLAERFGPVAGRRTVERLNRALRTAVYGSALYRVSLRGRRPDGLVFRPSDPWPGDAARGAALLANEYRFGGQSVAASGGVPGYPAGAAAPWLEEAHGFAWLRDLAAAGTAEARESARAAVRDWIATCGAWQALAWRADVLARRIVAWLVHAGYLFDGDGDLEAAALASLAEQVRHLGRVAGAAPDGEARIAALKGLVLGGLCLPGAEGGLMHGGRAFEHELNRQAPGDGGHVERSPSAHLRVFQDAVELRAAYVAAKRPVPGAVQGAIDRMAPMLRFFRHGDGCLALFNDSNEDDPAVIDTALALGDATGKPPSSAPHTGFERLAAGRTLVIADVGAPPPTDSPHTHAGVLSFELSAGKERLVVNCGAHTGEPAKWRAAQRATAAHSTVCVDDTNSVEVGSDGAVGRRPQRVACARHEDDGKIWIDASHDGYHAPFGLTHRRRIFLDADGADLRGEDVLEGAGGTAFAARFHLHPAVKGSLVGGGAGALLRLPGGDGWRFRASGGAIQIAESVYLGRRGEVRRSEQIVLTGPLSGGKTTIKWAFTRVGSDG